MKAVNGTSGVGPFQPRNPVNPNNVQPKEVKTTPIPLTTNTKEIGTDLLKSPYPYLTIGNENNKVADKTNEILASLGYNYKVSPTQVASVTNGFNNVVIPGMELAARGAVEANIQNPKGPFAELFV